MNDKKVVRLTVFLFALICFLSVSCSSESNYKENLENALFSIENNDYKTARSICDDVFNKESKSEEKDAELMAKLSVLYMKLADHNDMSDKEDNLDYAYECYEMAFEIDSVKASNYYMSLGMEDMPQVALLESIVKNSKMPQDSIRMNDTVNEMIDSLLSSDKFIDLY